jgi:hypothetical protein
MTRTLQTIHTQTPAEAGGAGSLPWPRPPVNDGNRLGSAVFLAERCVR